MAAPPIPASISPMEAKLVDALPTDAGWQFEPKWDGFRCLAFRDGGKIELMSKSGKSLARFFPEVVALIGRMSACRFVLDGELLIPVGDVLSFDALQARLHPAASRIAKLSSETPAQLMLFDCLQSGSDVMLDRPLSDRRAELERLFAAEADTDLLLSPVSTDGAAAASWLAGGGGALDGVVAKRLDEPYRPGKRAMLKVKQHRTADCVLGGFRYDTSGRYVASLLLGLFDDEGRLDHVGFTSAISDAERPELTTKLEAFKGGVGFSGNAPDGASRWSAGRSSEWVPLRPELVVEVAYDQVTSDRFRHGTNLVRWRPDKAPEQCRMEQLDHEVRPSEIAEIMRQR